METNGDKTKSRSSHIISRGARGKARERVQQEKFDRILAQFDVANQRHYKHRLKLLDVLYPWED